LQLEVKEGLALLNGTQAMGAVGALALHRAEQLTHLADVAGAMSLEALKGTPVAFDERIHAARPHAGQVAVAAHLRELLAGSEIRESHLQNDPRVQDAYSLRCMPQVHGAVRDALKHCARNLSKPKLAARPIIHWSSLRAAMFFRAETFTAHRWRWFSITRPSP
jgi:histidine ammonia-lyase